MSLFGEELAPPEWTYFFGAPKRPGILKYTHLIRSDLDPDETLGRGFGRDIDRKPNGKPVGRKPGHWKNPGSVAEFVKKIRKLMEDGRPRTFNAICVELTGTTADVWFEKEPDQALWQLVKDEELGFAQEMGAIFFCSAKFIRRTK
jgi:hypothetical protein